MKKYFFLFFLFYSAFATEETPTLNNDVLREIISFCDQSSLENLFYSSKEFKEGVLDNPFFYATPADYLDVKIILKKDPQDSLFFIQKKGNETNQSTIKMRFYPSSCKSFNSDQLISFAEELQRRKAKIKKLQIFLPIEKENSNELEQAKKIVTSFFNAINVKKVYIHFCYKSDPEIFYALISEDETKITRILKTEESLREAYAPFFSYEKCNNEGATALEYALWYKKNRYFHRLLEANKELIHYTCTQGRNPMVNMLLFNEYRTFHFLLKKNCFYVNAEDDSGMTALHYAASCNNPYTVKKLLEHPEILVNKKNPYNGKTALHYAGENKKEMVEMLLADKRVKKD